MILDKFRGMREISTLNSRKTKTLIASMTDKNGGERTDRQGIADAFADFYADLYGSRMTVLADYHTGEGVRDAGPSQVPQFTTAEVQAEVDRLKKGKCQDSAGLVAEMIKYGGAKLVEVLTGLYNDVLSPNALPPKAWKESIITVIHKSGAPDQPKNYRPITVIPILYKLFAMLLFRRLTPPLDRDQCADQAGFSAGYRTDDHISTATLLMQKVEEHQITL